MSDKPPPKLIPLPRSPGRPPGVCLVCVHPRVDVIRERIAEMHPYRAIAREFGLPHIAAISRHLPHDLKPLAGLPPTTRDLRQSSLAFATEALAAARKLAEAQLAADSPPVAPAQPSAMSPAKSLAAHPPEPSAALAPSQPAPAQAGDVAFPAEPAPVVAPAPPGSAAATVGGTSAVVAAHAGSHVVSATSTAAVSAVPGPPSLSPPKPNEVEILAEAFELEQRARRSASGMLGAGSQLVLAANLIARDVHKRAQREPEKFKAADLASIARSLQAIYATGINAAEYSDDARRRRLNGPDLTLVINHTETRTNLAELAEAIERDARMIALARRRGVQLTAPTVTVDAVFTKPAEPAERARVGSGGPDAQGRLGSGGPPGMLGSGGTASEPVRVGAGGSDSGLSGGGQK